MPVVGVGGYDNANYILNLARSIVNDAAQSLAGNLLSNSQPYTIPMLNSCYRKLQIDLINNGYEAMQTEVILLQVPPAYTVDPQVQIYVGYQGSNDGYNSFPNPYLPANLMIPLRLWERPTGTIQDYIEMQPVNDGLPSRPQSATLQQFDWRGEAIYFVGANQLNDIRLRFLQFFPDLADGTSIVLIPWSDRALSFLMGRTWGAARGSPMWQYMDTNYDEAMIDIVKPTSRKKQRGSHRRRPYGSSNAYYNSTYGWW
jgi:hypothetical protein